MRQEVEGVRKGAVRGQLLKYGLVSAVAGLVTVIAMAVLLSILERKHQARYPFFRVVELTDDITDPAVWGKNFPFQYDSYRRTVDQVRTRYGGSEALPRTPTNADPRSVVAQSKLEEDPRLKTMWAGYAFALDAREDRGHAYMLDDATFTGRQAKPQPGSCLNCHSSTYVAYKKLGNGDIVKGFERFNAMPFAEARRLVEHPVACIDCHEPQTMQLRITRPAFIEGIRQLKAKEGIINYDVNLKATRQEMRSFVCAQCHVEYYFKGDQKQLTFPWKNGVKVEEILAYYDDYGFRDWDHGETGAAVLKAQHPEFELWSQGIHARSGVACADCHMPYQRVGAFKVSDHHVRSPILNINRSCQTCHPWPEEELKARVFAIQDRTYRLRSLALDALMDLIADIKAARQAGRTEGELKEALTYHRKAQFYIDFIEAENSTGFHAPEEAIRILAEAIDFCRRGQVAIRKLDEKIPGVAKAVVDHLDAH